MIIDMGGGMIDDGKPNGDVDFTEWLDTAISAAEAHAVGVGRHPNRVALRRCRKDREILALCDVLDRDALNAAEYAGTHAPHTIRSIHAFAIRKALAEGYGYEEP